MNPHHIQSDLASRHFDRSTLLVAQSYHQLRILPPSGESQQRIPQHVDVKSVSGLEEAKQNTQDSAGCRPCP